MDASGGELSTAGPRTTLRAQYCQPALIRRMAVRGKSIGPTPFVRMVFNVFRSVVFSLLAAFATSLPPYPATTIICGPESFKLE